MCFIEAKRSYPDPIEGTKDEKKEQYYKEIKEIVEKMRHSLNLYASILLNRYSQDGVPDEMKSTGTFEMRLILVIKNAKKSWIPTLHDIFRKELNAEMRIWKIPDFIVMNEEMARKNHLII